MLVVVGSGRFQRGSALLVFLSFALTVAQSERLPPEDAFEYRIFNGIDIAFTAVEREEPGGGGGGGRMGACERGKGRTSWVGRVGPWTADQANGRTRRLGEEGGGRERGRVHGVE
jgi:hypothetical protein